MLKKYKKKPFYLEAVKIDHSNVKSCTQWLRENGEEASQFVSYVMFGVHTSQRIANVGEYLVRGLGGIFTVMSAELFEKCYEEDKKETAKRTK